MGKTLEKLETGEPLDLKDKAKVVASVGAAALGLLAAGTLDHQAEQVTQRTNDKIAQRTNETSSKQLIQTDDGRKFELNLETGQLIPIDTNGSQIYAKRDENGRVTVYDSFTDEVLIPPSEPES